MNGPLLHHGIPTIYKIIRDDLNTIETSSTLMTQLRSDLTIYSSISEINAVGKSESTLTIKTDNRLGALLLEREARHCYFIVLRSKTVNKK